MISLTTHVTPAQMAVLLALIMGSATAPPATTIPTPFTINKLELTVVQLHVRMAHTSQPTYQTTANLAANRVSPVITLLTIALIVTAPSTITILPAPVSHNAQTTISQTQIHAFVLNAPMDAKAVSLQASTPVQNAKLWSTPRTTSCKHQGLAADPTAN